MRRNRTYKVDDFLKAIPGSRGLLSDIADRIGCDRSTVYRAAQKYPTVQSAIMAERERMKDYVEGAMFKRISQGSDTMTIWYLKTQAKDRGYVERQELDHRGSLNVNLKWADDADADG